MEVGRYDVDGQYAGCGSEGALVMGRGALVGEVWDWLVQTTFVFVVKMPVYVCPRASLWVA